MSGASPNRAVIVREMTPAPPAREPLSATRAPMSRSIESAASLSDGRLTSAASRAMEGERVVASANFLIDAETKVQGAVKSFEEPPTEGAAKTAGALK